MTTQQAEQFEYRHPLMVFDIAACTRPELEYMEAMAESYAVDYMRIGDEARANAFAAALMEIRRRLESA